MPFELPEGVSVCVQTVARACVVLRSVAANAIEKPIRYIFTNFDVENWPQRGIDWSVSTLIEVEFNVRLSDLVRKLTNQFAVRRTVSEVVAAFRPKPAYDQSAV
jgi:hypothetical protein